MASTLKCLTAVRAFSMRQAYTPTARRDLSERASGFFIFYGLVSRIYAAEKSGGRLFSGPSALAWVPIWA